MTDGGTPGDEGESDPQEDAEADDASSEESAEDESAATDDPETGTDADRSNVDVMDAGEAEPADPKWEPPDADDIPEFEVRADQPVVEPGGDAGEVAGEPTDEREQAGGAAGTAGPGAGPAAGDADPTAGMPNDARAPGATAVSSGGTEAFVAALELCARLPEDVALPEEAADLVPAAVEAELEQDIQGFAAAEFDNPRPHVDTLEFEERDGDVWLRIRIGLPDEDFQELDPERLRTFALQELEGVL